MSNKEIESKKCVACRHLYTLDNYKLKNGCHIATCNKCSELQRRIKLKHKNEPIPEGKLKCTMCLKCKDKVHFTKGDNVLKTCLHCRSQVAKSCQNKPSRYVKKNKPLSDRTASKYILKLLKNNEHFNDILATDELLTAYIASKVL
jgi:uncharacterized CHY-type Zn-finger protein